MSVYSETECSYYELSMKLKLVEMLFDAIENLDLDETTKLLRRGADPSFSLPELGIAPAHYVCGDLYDEDAAMELMDLFLDLGRADIDCASDDEGMTPLQIAAIWDRAKLVSFLLDNGANPWLCDNSGKTAIDYAEKRGHKSCANLMKARGRPKSLKIESNEEIKLKKSQGIKQDSCGKVLDFSVNGLCKSLIWSHRKYSTIYGNKFTPSAFFLSPEGRSSYDIQSEKAEPAPAQPPREKPPRKRAPKKTDDNKKIEQMRVAFLESRKIIGSYLAETSVDSSTGLCVQRRRSKIEEKQFLKSAEDYYIRVSSTCREVYE